MALVLFTNYVEIGERALTQVAGVAVTSSSRQSVNETSAHVDPVPALAAV